MPCVFFCADSDTTVSKEGGLERTTGEPVSSRGSTAGKNHQRDHCHASSEHRFSPAESLASFGSEDKTSSEASFSASFFDAESRRGVTELRPSDKVTLRPTQLQESRRSSSGEGEGFNSNEVAALPQPENGGLDGTPLLVGAPTSRASASDSSSSLPVEDAQLPGDGRAESPGSPRRSPSSVASTVVDAAEGFDSSPLPSLPRTGRDLVGGRNGCSRRSFSSERDSSIEAPHRQLSRMASKPPHAQVGTARKDFQVNTSTATGAADAASAESSPTSSPTPEGRRPIVFDPSADFEGKSLFRAKCCSPRSVCVGAR